MSGFLATFQVPEQQILDQEQGPDPGLLSTRHFRHLEGRKRVNFLSFFSEWRPFGGCGFVQKMRLFYKFWAFPRGQKPGGMRKIRQKGGCLRWDMSHFSSENFDFRVLSEWKRLQFHDQEASTRGVHGVAYELLSRNPKSGYFVYNFDTKSVKLGFKIWLKNPLIFPISGHSARTLRPPPYSWSSAVIVLLVDDVVVLGLLS